MLFCYWFGLFNHPPSILLLEKVVAILLDGTHTLISYQMLLILGGVCRQDRMNNHSRRAVPAYGTINAKTETVLDKLCAYLDRYHYHIWNIYFHNKIRWIWVTSETAKAKYVQVLPSIQNKTCMHGTNGPLQVLMMFREDRISTGSFPKPRPWPRLCLANSRCSVNVQANGLIF